MFPRYFCEIGGDYNCSSDMSRLDMTAVSLNYLKFSLTSVKKRLVVMNIIIFSFWVMAYFCEKTETQLAVTTIVALTCPDLT